MTDPTFEKKCECGTETVTEEQIKSGLGKCPDCGCRYWHRAFIAPERNATTLPWA